MGIEKNTVDAQLLAIEAMKTEFLRFFNGSVTQSPEELRARQERIKAVLANCGGGLDGYWVAWLFYELEQRAFDELKKITLLAQTTDPDALRDKYFNDLPGQLVENVKTLKKYHQDTGMSKKGVNGIKAKKKAIEDEVIYRAKYFLENPEEKYKLKLENYRSSSLAKTIYREWLKPVVRKNYPGDELWRNKVNFDAPTTEKITEHIVSGVNKGELPDFLTWPTKPRWKD